MQNTCSLALLFALGLALAGCVGDTTGEAGPASTGAASASPGSFDESTGAISGIVTDAELTPLADAQLQLLGTEFSTTSAMDGSFSFSNLAPQQYTLAAARLGYSSASQRVEVQAGAAVEDVKLVLAPLGVLEARTATYEFKGFITCSIGAATIISEECGQGLQTPVGTYGRDPNNNIDWIFKIENKTDVEQLQALFLEMDWRPGSAAAGQLGFHVAHGFTCVPSCDEKLAYCEVWENYGPPVRDCLIDRETLGLKDPDTELPWDITARAWAAPVEPTEVPNIVLQQPVQMYRTEFYGEPMPEGYSAVPDS